MKKPNIHHLIESVEQDDYDKVKLILASSPKEKNKVLVNKKDENGRTPLHIACNEANLEIVQLFIGYGANVHERDNEGWTPLHTVCNQVDFFNCRHEKPIFFRKGKAAECVKMLIKHGANLNETDNEGWTPLPCLQQRKSGLCTIASREWGSG